MQEDIGKEEMFSKVLALTDLVGYQEGAIVSRTIVDEDTGTVTLFAFDKGQGLSEHTAPYDAMIYIIDGEAAVAISGRTFNLKKEQIIMMPANKPHSVKAISRFKMLLVMIKS